MHHWRFRFFKVNIYHTANAGCHLIHQAAGFTKEYIFYKLTHLCNFNGRKLFPKKTDN